MVICVTNRLLCKDNFLDRIENIAKMGLCAILLREKDLSEQEYEKLASSCREICLYYGTTLIIHTHIHVARRLGISAIHLPFNQFLDNTMQLTNFKMVGVSVHTVEESVQAQSHGANYLIAGHIFPTDCKRGLVPRGLTFLKNICDKVSIPVFAIGGITADRLTGVLKSGAAGCCVMSQLMTCDNPEYICCLLKEKFNFNSHLRQ
ncbi:thiamine phosphate synthase [Clostridium sp. WILCCON 0269]|uniref:Thiamine phosphate synthase n=1 Tax=Candidatus Clostridium eludens TaxID=3381663 RepID=A0ABW8SGW9_9CLOT